MEQFLTNMNYIYETFKKMLFPIYPNSCFPFLAFSLRNFLLVIAWWSCKYVISKIFRFPMPFNFSHNKESFYNFQGTWSSEDGLKFSFTPFAPIFLHHSSGWSWLYLANFIVFKKKFTLLLYFTKLSATYRRSLKSFSNDFMAKSTFMSFKQLMENF